MKTTNENIWNVPNALSAYRILALPFLIWSITDRNESLFILLISINLITDILDGLIARLFKLQTELGAKLDSIADIGTYMMAFTGMIQLKSAFVQSHRTEFILLIGLWLLPQLISCIRFRRFPSFHLWSYKITGYLQGIFIFTFFLFGYHEAYFYLMLLVSCMAYLEELTLVLILPQLKSNVKSLFLIRKS